MKEHPMKNRFQTLAIAAVLALGAAGCASKNSAVAETADAPAEAAATPAPAVVATAPVATPAPYVLVLKPPTVSAADWGSQPDPMPEALRHTPSRITLHHAGEEWKAGSDPYVKLKNLQTWGKAEKGWPDVPYHFLIAPDGRIFEGRSLDFAPDTNTNYDVKGHIGINVWGNFEVQRITQAQLESVVRLSAWLSDKYDLDVSTIASHRDIAPGQTVCPGKDYYRYIESGQMRDWISKALHGQEYKVELLPPAPDGPTEFVPN